MSSGFNYGLSYKHINSSRVWHLTELVRWITLKDCPSSNWRKQRNVNKESSDYPLIQSYVKYFLAQRKHLNSLDDLRLGKNIGVADTPP